MAIKTFKPHTPTLRYRSVSAFDEVTRAEPEKSLIRPLKKAVAAIIWDGKPADTVVVATRDVTA